MVSDSIISDFFAILYVSRESETPKAVLYNPKHFKECYAYAADVKLAYKDKIFTFVV